jgi:hypothetical protein
MSQITLHPGARIVNPDGTQTQLLVDFLRSLQGDPIFTLATLPKPKPGFRIFVEDATGGGVPCYADGTSWRRYSNDAVVS